MKKPIFLCASLLLFGCLSAQVEKPQAIHSAPTTESEGLRGKVKEVEVQEVMVPTDNVTNYIDTIFLHFNEEGQLLQRNSIWEEEFPFSDYQYTNGRLTKQISWNWSRKDSITNHYYYSSDGCLEHVVILSYEHGRIWHSDTDYVRCDAQCRIIMELIPDTISYTYDVDGNLTLFNGYDGYTRYIYDDKGRLVKKMSRHIGHCDENYTYNAQGDVEEYTFIYSTGDKEVTHFEYTYDNHGNWISRKSGINIIRRRITYYE